MDLELLIGLSWLSAVSAQTLGGKQVVDLQRITLAVHGGSGNLTPATLPSELAAQYRAGIERALQAGHAILASGGSSLDAVVAAIKVLEDDSLFNAGRGAVFTHAGKNELDASIMDGRSGQAGAVAGVTTVKNPIAAARALMEKTKRVLLVSQGGEDFAADQKLEIAPAEYFFTQRPWEQLQKAKEENQIKLDHDGKQKTSATSSDRNDALWETDHKYGTVGAVALDAYGNLAAGTSTGGLTNKLYGRVGDSPTSGLATTRTTVRLPSRPPEPENFSCAAWLPMTFRRA